MGNWGVDLSSPFYELHAVSLKGIADVRKGFAQMAHNATLRRPEDYQSALAGAKKKKKNLRHRCWGIL